MSMMKKRDHFKKYVDKKLWQRMKIYFFISLAMIAVAIYEVIISAINPLFAVIIFVGSIIVGYFLARMFHISWNPEEQVVTSRIDLFWGIILGVYILFSIGRSYLIKSLVDHSLVTVVTFAMISGIMIGRFLGMRWKIKSIFKKQNIGL